MFYIILYSSVSLLAGVMTFFRQYIVNLRSYHLSKKLHSNVIRNLLYSGINEFYDIIPLGRILNRLTRDLTILDTDMPYKFATLLVSIFMSTGLLFMIVYSTSWILLIPIAIFIFLCNYIRILYMNANREVVRIESVSKSPIVSWFI